MFPSGILLPALLGPAALALPSPAELRDVPRIRPHLGQPRGPATAASLQPGWDVEHYVLDVVLDPDDRTLAGTATITARARSAAPGPLLLHADGPTLGSVTVAGTAAPWTQDDDEVLVELPAVDSGDEVELVVTWTGHRDSGGHGLQWGDPVHSFHQPTGARDWLVVYDEPGDKATLDWRITMPSDWVVVANGEPAPPVDHGDGTTTSAFTMADPLPTYLMVLHASPSYEVWEDPDSALPVSVWARAPLLDGAVADLANTAEILAWMGERWTPYPWSRYRNVLAPFGGGMEHTTATTIGEEVADGTGRAELLNVHEAAHHWWGDLVTCATWDDLWLNEGFASHAELRWYEAVHGEEGRRAYFEYQRESYLEWKDFEGEFSLYDPNFMWGGTVYDKGSLVLEMLRQQLGTESFDAVLAEWATRHAHDVATTEDLRAVVDDVTGGDWAWFFDEWVYQAGEPEYVYGVHVRELAAEDGVQVDVWLEEVDPDGAWRTPLPARVDGEALSLTPGDGPTAVSLCLAQAPDDVVIDPELTVLHGGIERDDAAFPVADPACGALVDEDAPDIPDGGSFRGGPAACSATGVAGGLLLSLLPGAALLRRRRGA